MNNQERHLTETDRTCSRLSPTTGKKSGSSSSRNSNSPVRVDAVTGTLSHKITEARPSSWDSDDELALTFDNGKGRMRFSCEMQADRKSVAAELDELKRQFFQSSLVETEIEDLKERSDLILGKDRRQSPARVRRRSKSSSSSSTVVDATLQNSPKLGGDLFPQETLYDNVENFAPQLDLNSKFYLDNFFSELRRKRISMLEPTVEFSTNERDEDDYRENSDEFIDLNNCVYYSRTCRKLSQILEVEENKKDSDKDAEECSENCDLFLKFSRKSEDSNSPRETVPHNNNESLFKKAEEYELKSPNADVKNSIKNREANHLKENGGNNEEIISLTAKTGMIRLSSLKADEKQDDVSRRTMENFDLGKSASPTSRKSSRRGRNSRSSSRKSSIESNLQSPKFIINLGKESSRSLKVEDVKTAHSAGRSSTPGSDRSIKNCKSICPSQPEQEKNILELKSPSLASNPSLELEDILLEQEMIGRYVNYGEGSSRSEFSTKLPFESERSSRSSRSSRLHSQRSETEETESRRSSTTPRTEGEMQINTSRIESCRSRSREESKKSSLRELQIKLQAANGSCNVAADPRGNFENFEDEVFSKWVQQSRRSSRSEVIDRDNFDKPIGNDSDEAEELAQSGKLVLVENVDYDSVERPMTKKSRTNSEEPLNVEKSDELKETGSSADGSAIEECSSTGTEGTHRSKNGSESDKKLTVINEVSQEEIAIESPKLSRDKETTLENLVASLRSAREKSNESIGKFKCEGLWNDLIDTFTEDQKQPFSWEDNFTNFLNKKNVINSRRDFSASIAEGKFLGFERDKREQVDFIMRKKLTENVFWSPRKDDRISSPGKGLDKKENFLDLGGGKRKQIKNDSDIQNLYYFKVKKTGNFRIGEFGDVTCWNLGTFDAVEDTKPKGHGDGIHQPRKTANLNREHCEKNSKTQRINSKAQKLYRTNDNLNLTSIFQGDLKPSKSDSSINPTEFTHFLGISSSNENIFQKSNREKPSLFENEPSCNLQMGSSRGSVKYSSSEWLSDESDNREFDWKKVQRSISALDLPGKLRKSGDKKTESNENLYNSERRLFEGTRTDTRDEGATNFNIFLAHKEEKNSKPNRLADRRENKKSRLKIDKSLIKKHSKEYLSLRTRRPLPVLKLRHPNCFQNFYKRFISVFCMAPNSPLPTSK